MSPSPSSSPSSESPDEKTEKPSGAPVSSSISSWTSWFVSPSVLQERFQEFDDQQRIERLSECRKLDKILRECRKRHHPGKAKSRYTKNTDQDDPIESVSIGVRNMKYFGWRGILKSPSPSPSPSQSTPKDEPSAKGEPSGADNETVHDDVPDLSVFHPKIRSSCAREEHAVWACRAISTGCGKDLADLKRCFDDVDQNSEGETSGGSRLPQHIRVLMSSFTNYQGIVEKIGQSSDATTNDNVVSMKQRIPCYEIQRRLGSCVTENGTRLLDRKQQRDRLKKDQQH